MPPVRTVKQCDGVVNHVLQGVRCVVFDVVETLVNESRIWASIANECIVPVATVCGVLGGLIERGEHHGRRWDVLGVDRGVPHFVVERRDLYPNALDCIDSARRQDLTVGVAGNQPVGFEDAWSLAGVRPDTQCLHRLVGRPLRDRPWCACRRLGVLFQLLVQSGRSAAASPVGTLTSTTRESSL
jgi:hypothetical protein